LALERFARSEEAAAGYSQHGARGSERLTMTVDLAEQFKAWSEAPAFGGSENRGGS
jgi:hypothetical protein